MKLSTVTMLAAACVAAAAGAYETPFGGDFAEVKDDGFPAAWIWHDYPALLPHADLAVEKGEGGNVLHYFNTRGENGSALRSRKRIPGKAGEIVTVTLEARGSGKAWFSMYCWGEGRDVWVRSLTPHEIKLSDEWTRHSCVFTIEDGYGKPPDRRRTASFEVALGLKPGADARFRNVRVVRRLETESVLESDDYEKDKARPGNPRLVRGDIAPGLLSPTGMGVYRTTGRVDIVPSARHELPSEGGFLTSGVRIYGLGGAALLGTGFAHDGGKFVFAVAPAGKDVVCSFSGGGRFSVPATMLPADFLFSAASNGIYELSVKSLANSRSMHHSGTSGFFAGAAKGMTRTVALFSRNGKPAEAKVDDVLLAVSRPERVATIDYPYIARPEAECDPVKAGWPLVLSDEFDGSEVDGAKWDLMRRSTGDNTSVSNGILRIRTDHDPARGGKLGTAALWSVPTFCYGYFESRLKFTTYNGWWAAFWLMSRAVSNPFLDGFEIDIFEDYYMRNPARNVLDHNLHIRGSGPLKSWNYNSTLPGTYRDWYTIACKWTPFEITYYLDGKAIRSTSNHSPYDTVTFDAFRHGACIKPLHAIVSGQIMTTAYGKHDPDPSEVFPEFFEVDYVRVYGYPGSLPGAAPEVGFTSALSGRLAVPEGTLVSFKASPKPARKTGAKIKAVHLFDSGYYVCTKTEAPYDFVFPMSEEYFAKTGWGKPGRSGVRAEFNGSYHVFCAFAEDENGEVGHSDTISLMVAPNGKSRPYQGVAAKIPGTIAVGRYDEGGPGVAYYDSTPGNVFKNSWRQDEGVDGSEHSVGGMESGEWAKYTVDIAKAGRYLIRFRYGTPSPHPHTVDFLLDDVKIATLGPLKRHATEDWAADTVAEAPVKLPSGRHVLMVQTFGQFNYVDIEVVEAK